LKIFVLDRLINVSKQVININHTSAFNQRIPITGNDELDEMTKAINSLMEIIYLSQEQLKNRIFLRTEELERLSQLNKNLYAEMSNQKQIEVKLREGEERLRHMAYYDALTGLPNRMHFNEAAHKIMDKAKSVKGHFAILFIDIDKFKEINDTHGHKIGDLYLRYTADMLKMAIREGDVAARLAGDEFLLCLSDVADDSAVISIVKCIINNLSKPMKTETSEVSSSFSIGIAIYPEDGTSVTDLERNADLAMYYAKKNPDVVYCFYRSITSDTTTD
jgi:diguanylate cyclase (GGDEF)-like protein